MHKSTAVHVSGKCRFIYRPSEPQYWICYHARMHFRNGVISFWNIRGDAIDGILSLSRSYADDIYPARLVSWESEEVPYLYHDSPTVFKDGE